MYKIPDIEDKIQALFIYLNNNDSVKEGDSWHFCHNPNIVDHINDFSKTDCEKLTSVIWDWKDRILCHLADPLLDISNPNLDGYYLYGKIFLKITDVELSDYLVEKTHLMRCISKGSRPIKFYLDLEAKIALFYDEEGTIKSNALEQIRIKIDEETAYLSNN